MTLAETCRLALRLTRALRDARRERDAFRLVANRCVARLRQQAVELEALRGRYYALLDARRDSGRAA